MNIFFLDPDPERAAQLQADKHLGKVGILECGQMLASAIRRHTGNPEFKWGYRHHPMTLWVGDTHRNFLFTLVYAKASAREWEYRFGKPHAGALRLPTYEAHAHVIPDGPLTVPPLCMPDEHKRGDPVESYRTYYRQAKRAMARWTRRDEPAFMGADHRERTPMDKDPVAPA
ncbi:MAG TPA: hypothetical protein VEY95_16980 [Azospirillaceae bacterium]|nr:hypothetical protein [Azospirillaceae bacterium]